MKPQHDELLTLKQLAKRWNFCVRYVRRLIVDEGRLPFMRLGSQRGIRVQLTEVIRYERSRLEA